MPLVAAGMTAVTLISLEGVASADQLGHDSFALTDYPAGTQIAGEGANEGHGYKAFFSGTNFRFVSTATSLGYTDGNGKVLPAKTGALTMSTSASGTQEAKRGLKIPFTSGDLYFSFLLERTEGTSWGIVLMFQDGSTPLCAVRSTSGEVWGTEIPSIDSDVSTSSSAMGATTLVVGRIQGVGGAAGSGKIELWLNPSDLENVAATAESTVVSQGGTFPSISNFFLSLGSDDNVLWDEMRIGSDLAGVLEPQLASAWLDYVREKDSAQQTTLPDFSYCGYDFGRTAIPDVNHAVYDVTNYGAVPGDGLSDRAAVLAAVAAAEASGSPAVVFFPPGKFRLLEPGDTDNGSIRISKNHIVIRGSGSGEGGTEIFMNDRHDNPVGLDYSTPHLFYFLPGGPNKVDITTVTTGGARGTKTFTVADASNLSPGQRVYLSMLNNSTSVLERYMGPYKSLTDHKPWDIYTSGVQVREVHEIESINGNQVTFVAPTKHEIIAADGWSLQTFGHLEGVGLEDIFFRGNWTQPFVHHRDDVSDSAWSAVNMGRSAHSWIRRCRFQNWSRVIQMTDGVANSMLQLEMDGNNGHNGIILRGTHTLAGLVQENALFTHGPEVSRWSSGVTFWRYHYHQNTEFSGHGSQPYATLLDRTNGGLHPERGASGASAAQPSHLGYYTMWNFKQTGQFPYPDYRVWEPDNGSFPGYVQPINVGFSSESGTTTLLKTSNGNLPQYQILQSVNQPVIPESLYEAQLEKRMTTLPAWVSSHKDEWMLRSNTTATITSPADQSEQAHTGSISLVAAVPSEIASLVTRVDFFRGNQFLGSDTTAPYTWNWTSVPEGAHTVRAKVTRLASAGSAQTYSRFGEAITFYTGATAVTPLVISGVTTPHEVSPNVASNVLDENPLTYWYSNGPKIAQPRKDLMLDFDLGSVKQVNRIDIAWRDGDAEQNQFAVWLSNDGSTWRRVLTRFSSGTTLNYESHYFTGGPARYVRLNPFGSNAAISAGITRVRLYAPGAAAVNRPPEFVADVVTKPDGEVAQPYVASVSEQAYDPDVHDLIGFSKTGGPGWAVVSPEGLITGTPDQSGVQTLTVTVTDSHGATDTMDVNLYVDPGYNDWVQAADGTSPHTLYLWHCDQQDLNAGKNGGDAVDANKVDAANTQLSAGPISLLASQDAVFAPGGKFGWGLHNQGGSDSPSDAGKIDPSADGQHIFPTGSDPSLSVECWVKFNSLGSRQFLIDKKHGFGDASGGYRLYIEASNTLHWRLGNGTSSLNISAAPALSTGVWYHIAGTWDAATDTSTLYVDGQMLASTQFPGSTILNNTRPLVVANRQVSTYNALDGVIDEIKISDKAYRYAPAGSSPWEVWRRAQFTDAQRDSGEADRLSDADGDGLHNLGEFLLAADPNDAASAGVIAASIVNVSGDDYATVSYLRKSGGTHTYQIQRSLELTEWSDADDMVLVSVNNHVNGTETVTLREPSPLGNDKVFYRLKVDE